MKYIIAACLLALSGAAVAQSEISQYKPGVTPEGAVYFLPKTAIRIAVQVEKTTYTPGDFSKYAERYLRLNDVNQEKTVSYRIANIGLTSYGVPDEKKVYAVKFNPKSVAANVKLADSGILLAINADAKQPKEPAKFTPSPKKPVDNPRNYMSEDILSSGSVAKMAEMTAQEIYEIRDSRNQLNRGEADFMPKDGEQLRLMLANLDKQENALLQLFTGTIEKDTTEQIIEFCPEGEVNKQVVFRLSQRLGLVDADDLSGTPYYLSIEDLHNMPATPSVVVDETKKKSKTTESGVYVNIPGKIKATLYKGNREMGNFELYAAQFGKVELLSGELFNKRSTTHLTMNSVTGSVDRLEAEVPR